MAWNIKSLLVYEDSDLLVCKKPAGLPVQTRRMGQMDLESLIKNELAAREPGRVPYLGVIHRLDQPVEGITLFAKNPRAAANLSAQLQQEKMEKEYLAVTECVPAEQKGELVDWLVKDGRTNLSRVADKSTPGAKRAHLSYEVLERQEDRTLLLVHLGTGRHHQIRVQLAHAGMALAGDRKYHSGETRWASPALCAWKLSFSHPRTGKRMSFSEAPEGAAFVGFSCLNVKEP